jgi:hypothetical protein
LRRMDFMAGLSFVSFLVLGFISEARDETACRRAR